MNTLRNIYKFFSSYGLATVVLILLTLVTLLGTIDQVYLGLFQALKKYFHSFWFIKSDYLNNFGIPIDIILPGGLLLMILLFINMFFGGFVHVRKRIRGIPNMISHFGIMFLLVSAAVTFWKKNDGYVALFPGQMSNVVHSYKEWQLEVLEFDDEGKPSKAHVIPWKSLLSVGEGKREFYSKKLPFSVEVDTFMRNASPIPASAPMASRAGLREVNGFKLLFAKKDKREERNFPGCFAKILVGDDKKEVEELIISSYSASLMAGDPARVAGFKVDGKQYGLQLVKVHWPLDYYIKLDKFIYEKHPGTNDPKNYESRVTRIEKLGKEGKKVAIRMNVPMRHSGFVVFQESYGQHPETGEYYSQFAVSDNPSDLWPQYALGVIILGLLFHFIWRLVEYLMKSQARPKKTSPKTA